MFYTIQQLFFERLSYPDYSFHSMYYVYTEREGTTLKKQKLKFTFHNPNSKEETVKYLSKLLAEAAVCKVVKAQEVEYNKQKILI